MQKPVSQIGVQACPSAFLLTCYMDLHQRPSRPQDVSSGSAGGACDVLPAASCLGQLSWLSQAKPSCWPGMNGMRTPFSPLSLLRLDIAEKVRHEQAGKNLPQILAWISFQTL